MEENTLRLKSVQKQHEEKLMPGEERYNHIGIRPKCYYFCI